jgi:hypothetical protein
MSHLDSKQAAEWMSALKYDDEYSNVIENTARETHAKELGAVAETCTRFGSISMLSMSKANTSCEGPKQEGCACLSFDVMANNRHLIYFKTNAGWIGQAAP